MTNKRKIILVGGGGHAKVLIDLIRLAGEYEIAGILDHNHEPGNLVSGIPVLGNDDMLPEIFAENITNVCIGVGSVKDTLVRTTLFKKVKGIGFFVPPLIHPSAVVSEYSVISEGVQLMVNTVIQPGVTISENTLINTGTIIEHDGTVGRHVHVCPGVVISGVCKIGNETFIGAGATVINGLTIGDKVTVAAGSVVVHDIADGASVKGVPAR